MTVRPTECHSNNHGRGVISPPPGNSTPRPPSFRPRAYQKRALQLILKNKCAALLMDLGTGKTATSLMAVRIAREKGLKTLVVAPLRIINSTWVNEIRRWREFCCLKHTVLHGLRKSAKLLGENDVYFINPEGLKWLVNSPALEKHRFDLIIFDESTAFKNPKTQRFNVAARQLLPRFPQAKRVILTGLPIPRSYQDLWAQYYLLDGGQRLGRYSSFLRDNFTNYEVSLSRGSVTQWGLKKGQDKVISRRLSDITISVSQREANADLPGDPVPNVISIPLPDGVMEQYRALEEKLIVNLADKRIERASDYMPCRQFANGFLYEEGKVLRMHDEKIEMLKVMIDSLGGKPAVVVSDFHADLDLVDQTFGCKYSIRGSNRGKGKIEEIVEQWNTGNIPVLTYQASLGYGLNLQGVGAADMIFYGIPDNYDYFYQMRGRLHRSGIKETIGLHFLVAQGTIDEAIVKRNLNKELRGKKLIELLSESG